MAQSQLVSEQKTYGTIRHCVLQAVMNAKILPVYEFVKTFYAAQETWLPESGPIKKAIEKITPEECYKKINDDITPYGFTVRLVKSETHMGQLYFAFVNTSDDHIAKAITPLGANAYVGFKRVFEDILDNDHGYITVQRALAETPGNMKAAEWSATLQALAADHWLEIDGQARVFLGLRAHAELRDVLRESDVPVCPTCNEPVVKGEQKEVAGGSVVKVHLHCLRVAAASDGSGASSSSAAVKSAAAQMTLLKHAYGDWKYKHAGDVNTAYVGERDKELEQNKLLATTHEAARIAALALGAGGAAGGGGKRKRGLRQSTGSAAASSSKGGDNDTDDDTDGVGAAPAPKVSTSRKGRGRAAAAASSRDEDDDDEGADGAIDEDDEDAKAPSSAGKASKSAPPANSSRRRSAKFARTDDGFDDE